MYPCWLIVLEKYYFFKEKKNADPIFFNSVSVYRTRSTNSRWPEK